MHNWKVVSRPWPGIRWVECNCGTRRFLVGPELALITPHQADIALQDNDIAVLVGALIQDYVGLA